MCTEDRPHWHETDPRPVEVGYASAPVDNDGILMGRLAKESPETQDAYWENRKNNAMKDAHYWPYRKYNPPQNQERTESLEDADYWPYRKYYPPQDRKCYNCQDSGYVPTLIGLGDADKWLGTAPVLGNQEPAPIFQPGTSHVVWPTLYTYMRKRVERGLEKYGQHLSTHDGRDGLHDALDEAIDLCFYLIKIVMEEQDERIRKEYQQTGLKGGVEDGY